MNQFILLGRYVENKGSYFTLNVTSSTKNENGEYENYKIMIAISDNINKHLKEHVSKDDIISVKGHILNNNVLQADKISFLTSKKVED